MNKITITTLLFLGILLVGCTTTPTTLGTAPTTNIDLEDKGLQTFATDAELNTYLLAHSQNNMYGGYARGGLMMDAMVKTASLESNSAPQAAGGANDYSQTNVQVQGVDEADFVKNDGRYIYMLQNNVLIIVDAYDAKNADIISETELPKEYYASNLFIYEDKVIVLAQSNEQSFYFMKYDIMPQPNYEPITKVLIYDTIKKSAPKLLNEFEVSGDYYQSRMIDNVVYVVSTKYASYPARPPIVYAEKIINPTIYYFDNDEESYNYNTMVSVDVDSEKVVDSETYLLGYSNTLMMSEDNIYISYQKQPYRCWGWYCRDNSYDKNRFTDVVVPLLPVELKSDIQSIINARISEDEQWKQISDVLTTFYKEIQNDESLQNKYENMFDDISNALDEYDTKALLENSKTIIHKINVNEGKLFYESKGQVDGRLLNQFSLDEYKGNLRVATTVDLWLNNGRKNYNNVYVLDENMKTVGSVENIAQNESIYATRFMGDKLYMVTFRQIDPFFVIDLSNPRNPKILGQLKIPGYSSYLHPISDTLILGIGKETGENQWGGTSTQGVKISLFDVSDFKNPKEVQKYEIGMAGSDSPILYDHKAFLYSATKGIFVIPVSEVTSKNSARYGYNYAYWDGAYVFNIDNNGFDLLGKVKHDSRSSTYYNWYDRASVSRSLYMDNNLYTISNKYIKINSLVDDLSSIKSITLPDYNKYVGPYYGGVSEPGVVEEIAIVN
jgi:uncharacterized secreted protein with C-terminal beta-propeller domain